MTKSYGAQIFCSVCHAEPFPDDPATIRETFDLLKIDGVWFCERHRPPKNALEESASPDGVRAAEVRQEGQGAMMSDLSEILSDLVHELTPIHEAEAAFAKGGPGCARTIARIYQTLVDAEPLARYLESEVAFLEEELSDARENAAEEPADAQVGDGAAAARATR